MNDKVLNAIEIATLALSVGAETAPEIGSEDHISAANDALNAATVVASNVITDPTQKAEANAAAMLASAVIKLFAAFTNKKKK